MRQALRDAQFAALLMANGRARARRVLGKLLLRALPRVRGPVQARIFGREVTLDAQHHLPAILAAHPLWSRALIHVVSALRAPSPTIVDVGANIGDTVLLIEQAHAGRCQFVCVEPDPTYFAQCETNVRHLGRVELHRRFIGEGGHRLRVERGAPGTATSVADPD
jgi:hypothetical protein